MSLCRATPLLEDTYSPDTVRLNEDVGDDSLSRGCSRLPLQVGILNVRLFGGEQLSTMSPYTKAVVVEVWRLELTVE